ncbi:MAG: hypothetical protein ACFCUQ_22715 [Kiloniellales bacterium]
MFLVALALWAAFLVAAIFYCRHARHAQTRPLAAYLIFVIVFTVSSFVIFTALSLLLQALGQAGAISHPAGAALFLTVVFIPAFFIARWQLRKPPRASKVP